RGRGGAWGRGRGGAWGTRRAWSGSGSGGRSGVGRGGRSGVGRRRRSGVGTGGRSAFIPLAGRGSNDVILPRASEGDQSGAWSGITPQRSQHAIGAVVLSNNRKVVIAYNFPDGDL